MDYCADCNKSDEDEVFDWKFVPDNEQQEETVPKKQITQTLQIKLEKWKKQKKKRNNHASTNSDAMSFSELMCDNEEILIFLKSPESPGRVQQTVPIQRSQPISSFINQVKMIKDYE